MARKLWLFAAGAALYGACFVNATSPAPTPTPRTTVPLVTQKVILRALDKVTGHVRQIEVATGQSVSFERLHITSRACRKALPEDPPESVAFLEIQEEKAGHLALVFSGWMFASTPAISAMEHPVYDVWVVECTGAQHEEGAKDKEMRVEALTLRGEASPKGGIECEAESAPSVQPAQPAISTGPLPPEDVPDTNDVPPSAHAQEEQLKAFHEGLKIADDDQPPVGTEEESALGHDTRPE